MRNTMGQYLDQLDDVGRDRVITAAGWTDGAWWEDGCGCLVGTVHNGNMDAINSDQSVRAYRAIPFDEANGWASQPPHHRYWLALERFGEARVIRAIKKRAGYSVPTEIEPEVLTLRG